MIQNLIWKIFDLNISARGHITPETLWSVFGKENMIFTPSKTLIRCKGHPESIGDRREKSNFTRGTYPQILFLYNTLLSVTCFYKICGLPEAGRLLETLFPFHLEW